MKKYLLILLAVAMASCKKESKPLSDQQVVRYHVECKECLIYIEDNNWNHLNELERSKNQHINVDGTFDYEFINTKLDSLTIRFYVGVLSGVKTVKGTVSTNDGKSIVINDKLGMGGSLQDYPLEKSFTLKLK